MQHEPAKIDASFARFCRSGDAHALGEVYDHVAPELYRLALHTTRDAAQAEDVLQATFVAAIERRASFDPSQHALPWLIGILANEAKRARARAQRQIDPAQVEVERSVAPHDDAERAELLAHLDAALAKLPGAFRPALVLRFKHGLSASEIADALGIPPGTVRSQLARGTEQLRRFLPAGLAGAWLASLSPPTRGLALVRASIVAHASALPTSVATSAALSGLVAMKKFLVAAVVAALFATAWIAWPNARPARPPAGELVVAPSSELAAAASSAPQSAPVGELDSNRVAAQVLESKSGNTFAPNAQVGATLVVRALWPDDGQPAAGEIALVHAVSALRDETIALRTDELGVARFAGLPAGATLVRLLRGGEQTLVLAPGAVTEIELRVQAGVSVVGTVSDATGRALGGAEIWVSERYRKNLGHVLTRTDDRGRFALRAISPDHSLAARAEGFATSELRTVRGQPGDELQLAFVVDRAGVVVHGHVRDERGEPVSNAQIMLGDEIPSHTQRLDDGSFGFGPPPVRSLSDARGEFELAHVPFGLATVQARARGFAPFAAEFETTATQRSPLTIVLVREARVEGRVLDGQGRPVASAWVHAGDPDRLNSSTTASRRDGRFALEGLPSGAIRVVAEDRERGRAEVELVLASGATAVWEPRLQRELAIQGRVLDHQHQPLQGWMVVALPGGDPSRRLRSQTTDRSGAFSIDGVEDELHTLWIQRSGGWRDFPAAIVRDVRPSPTPLELSVPDPSAIAARVLVRVLTPSREPLAGVELQLWHEEAKLWRTFVSDGDDGLIACNGVPPGAVELDLRHADYPWVHVGRRELAAGETLDLGEIVLSEPGRIHGRVRGVDDATLAGLATMVSDSHDRESGVVRLESGGELSSGPLAAGRHTLVLRGDFVRTVRREFEVREGAETQLDVALERCALRRVVFELPAGAARPKWLSCSAHDVSASNSPPEWFDSLGSQGTFEARVALARGVYRFFARGEGGWHGEAELAIDADAGELPLLVVQLSRP